MRAAGAPRDSIAASGRAAFVTIVATIASFLTLLFAASALRVDPSVAITAAALALSLGRRIDAHGVRSIVSEWLALPLVAVVASAVGLLLRAVPLAGALAFVAGIFCSVWLRQFGPRAKFASRTLALPFIVILIVPPPRVTGAPWIAIALTLATGLVALAWVRIAQIAARSIGFVDVAPPRPEEAEVASGRARVGRKLSATTRLAIQMAVALAAAFAAGMLVLPQHWSWVVLTAFIVCSGNVGRGDVLYKSIVRLAGAVAGTVAATLVQRTPSVTGVAEAALIFAALFAGLWLRERNYAWWAACVTLVVALLQRGAGDDSAFVLLQRIEGIAIGAICGVAASWFVVPIRSRSVVLLRLSETLVALDDAIGSDSRDERDARLRAFQSRFDRLERTAPPFHLHHRVRRGAAGDDHPAVWIATMRDCRLRVDAFAGDGSAVVNAVRLARRAIGRRVRPDESPPEAAPESLTEALRRVRAALGDGTDS